MSPARSALRAALLSTGAAGVLAVPVTATVLAQSPMEAAAAPLPAAPRIADHSAHLDRVHARTHTVVGAQIALAEQQYAAEQAALAAARAEAERVAAEQAALAAAQAAEAQRVAAEQAAAQQAAQQAAEQAAEQTAAAAAPAPARASRSSRTPVVAATGDPRSIARAMLAARGEADQFSCLDRLWTKESGWSTTADNPTSSAYGIPQALPGSKMASAGADWASSARTQITWGLGYIEDRYGSPCAAWSHSQANNWY